MNDIVVAHTTIIQVSLKMYQNVLKLFNINTLSRFLKKYTLATILEQNINILQMYKIILLLIVLTRWWR